MELNMDPLTIVLWIIGIALFAIIPCGIVLTRNGGGKSPGTTPH
jgi:hypothetical protein